LSPGSWEQVGLDRKRATAFVGGIALALFASTTILGLWIRLGSVSFVLGSAAAAASAYLLATAPRRNVRIAAFEQTLEAPSFAASSNIYLKSTSSRSKSLLLLRAEEPHLRYYLTEVKRRVLLGQDPPSATMGALPKSHVFSESTKTVLDSVVGIDRARVEEGSEELDGMLSSGGLDEETKLPVLIAICFFLPIMVMLFAALTKQTAISSLGGMAVLEIIILDLTLAVSGNSVSWAKEAGT